MKCVRCKEFSAELSGDLCPTCEGLRTDRVIGGLHAEVRSREARVCETCGRAYEDGNSCSACPWCEVDELRRLIAGFVRGEPDVLALQAVADGTCLNEDSK